LKEVGTSAQPIMSQVFRFWEKNIIDEGRKVGVGIRKIKKKKKKSSFSFLLF
jgi:hypothetical protein